MSKIKLPHSSGNSMSIAAPATNPSGDLELKLPVDIGAAGKVLSVDGSGNLKFIYPSGYGYFQAYLSGGNQTLTHNTQTIITLNAETFDSQGWFNTSTYKYTPQVAGKYVIYAQADITDIDNTAIQAALSIYKNGSTMVSEVYGGVDDVAYNFHSIIASSIVDFNGSSDYVQMRLYLYEDGGGNGSARGTTERETFMNGYLLEAA